jgi:hypothetical protein
MEACHEGAGPQQAVPGVLEPPPLWLEVVFDLGARRTSRSADLEVPFPQWSGLHCIPCQGGLITTVWKSPGSKQDL